MEKSFNWATAPAQLKKIIYSIQTIWTDDEVSESVKRNQTALLITSKEGLELLNEFIHLPGTRKILADKP